MFKKPFLLMLFSCVFILLTSCTASEIKRDVMNVKYTASYTIIETNFLYEVDVNSGNLTLLPYKSEQLVDEKYEVEYKITYEDGTTNTVWETVDKDTYTKEKQKIP